MTAPSTPSLDPASTEPEDLETLTYLSDGRRVSFTLDEDLYPRDVIFGAAYLFIDRCYIFLSRPGDKQVEIRLKSHNEISPEELAALAGSFANALLDQLVRFRVSESTGRIREYYMARAFLSNTAQSSIDQLLAELDAEELDEDDLEIQVPWETGSGANHG